MFLDAKLHYQDLSPDAILDALESINIFPETGLLALNSYENRVYQFKASDQNRYVVKFYRPNRWSSLQIQEELDFLDFLHQNEIPVVPALKFNSKNLQFFGNYPYAVFLSTGGRTFEIDNYEQLERVGLNLGRLHQYSKQFKFKYRELFSLDKLSNDIEILKEGYYLPSHLSKDYLDSLNSLEMIVKKIWPINLSQIALHGDLHPGNILFSNDSPYFVDFDDASMGPAVQDIWMLLHGEKNQEKMQLELILENYNKFCDFNLKELEYIEVFRSYRLMYYSAWICRRYNDFTFQKNFPWFNSPSYWQEQTLLFNEQCRLLS